MKKFRNSIIGVSEVLGTILLLLISVSIFSVVYVSLFSVDLSHPTPSVDIIGSIKDNNLLLEHCGGGRLPLDTQILIENEISITAELLDNELKDDGYWDIGEIFSYSLDDLNDFNRFSPLNITVVDINSNSVILMGAVQEIRSADLELELFADEYNPFLGGVIEITLKIENKGQSDAEDIIIKDLLPAGLEYRDHTATTGSYSSLSGIWEIEEIGFGNIETLTIQAKVVQLTSVSKYTQLAFVIDGSDSVDDYEFNLTLQAIADSIRDGSIPHNEMVELSIFQYYSTYIPVGPTPHGCITPYVKTEIGPIELNNIPGHYAYYKDVANQIENIPKRGGASPLPLAFVEVADVLAGTGSFHSNNVHIINIVTDGRPNVPFPYPPAETPPGYGHTEPEYNIIDDIVDGPSKIDVEEQRDYMVNRLRMSLGEDEINVFAIDGSWGTDIEWLIDSVAWPLGYEAPPFIRGGWVVDVQDIFDLQYSIEYEFDINMEGRVNIAKILSAKYFDPNPSNNEKQITILPAPNPE